MDIIKIGGGYGLTKRLDKNRKTWRAVVCGPDRKRNRLLQMRSRKFIGFVTHIIYFKLRVIDIFIFKVVGELIFCKTKRCLERCV